MHKHDIATAYHEAGHAVAAIEAQRPITSATIVPNGDYLGCVLYRAWGNFNPELNGDLRTMHRLECTIHTLLAGGVAEERFTGKWNKTGTSSDMQQAFDLASYVHFDPEVCGKYHEFKMAACRSWVYGAYQWVAIKRVAEKLLAKKTLSARAIRAIYRDVINDPELPLEQAAQTKRLLGSATLAA